MRNVGRKRVEDPGDAWLLQLGWIRGSGVSCGAAVASPSPALQAISYAGRLCSGCGNTEGLLTVIEYTGRPSNETIMLVMKFGLVISFGFLE